MIQPKTKNPTKEMIKDIIDGIRRTIKDNRALYGGKIYKLSVKADKIAGKILPKEVEKFSRTKYGRTVEFVKPTSADLSILQITSDL